MVSVSWLASHLHQPDLVVLDATLPLVGVQPVLDAAASYREQHIPGALFFDIEALSDRHTSLPHMLPSPAAFGEAMGALGVPATGTLVVYDQHGIFSAPRARWMLRTLGARDVRVLDGGLPAWQQGGHATEAGTPWRQPVGFQAVLQPQAVVTFGEIQQILASVRPRTQILDARSASRFAGSAPEPRPGLSSGHMPGSLSVPYTELLQDGGIKDPEQLRTVFDRAGVDLEAPLVTTCGSGITAAVLALGLERCGVPNVPLYDGSWAEYAQQPEAVIVKGTI